MMNEVEIIMMNEVRIMMMNEAVCGGENVPAASPPA